MNTTVAGHLRVERRRDDLVVVHRDDVVTGAREYLDVRPDSFPQPSQPLGPESTWTTLWHNTSRIQPTTPVTPSLTAAHAQPEHKGEVDRPEYPLFTRCDGRCFDVLPAHRIFRTRGQSLGSRWRR